MNARTDALTSAYLEEMLASWFGQAGFKGVKLYHEHNPAVDKHSEYSVVYEAVFDPTANSSARVEIWLTDDGRVAIGIDTYERIAHRLKCKCLRRGFAAGHEPRSLQAPGLISLLNIVADGDIAMLVSALPVIGPVGCKAVTRVAEFDELLKKHYPTSYWLKVVDATKFSNSQRVVRFDKWR